MPIDRQHNHTSTARKRDRADLESSRSSVPARAPSYATSSHRRRARRKDANTHR